MRGGERPALARGALVTLRFDLAERSVKLAGEVAWYREDRDPAQPVDLGIRLRLRASDCDYSRAYASWIVPRLSRAMNRELELGVVLMRVALLPVETLQVALQHRKRTSRPLGDILVEMNEISDYELRLAKSCRLICAEDTIPASLLAWQQSLESALVA
jgi:hypothetical protein